MRNHNFLDYRYSSVLYIFLTLASCEKKQNYDGEYVFKKDTIKLEIRVKGNKWTAKSYIGDMSDEELDIQNEELDSGILKDSILYDRFGKNEIAYINNLVLKTTIGGHAVLLNKIK